MECTSIFQDAGVWSALAGLLSALLTAAITWATRTFSKATGIKVEQSARDALHSAIRTAVLATLEGDTEVTLDTLKARVRNYAKVSVPDAIKILVPGDGVLDELALRYYREAMGDI